MEEARAGRVDLEGERWAAAEILAEEIRTHWVQPDHGLAIVEDSSEMGECAVEGFQGGARPSLGIRDVQTQEAQFPCGWKARGGGATQRHRVSFHRRAEDIPGRGVLRDVECRGQVRPRIFRETGLRWSEASPNSVRAGELGGERDRKWARRRASWPEELKLTQRSIREEELERLSVEWNEMVFREGRAHGIHHLYMKRHGTARNEG
jgi:hypothetical protein